MKLKAQFVPFLFCRLNQFVRSTDKAELPIFYKIHKLLTCFSLIKNTSKIRRSCD